MLTLSSTYPGRGDAQLQRGDRQAVHELRARGRAAALHLRAALMRSRHPLGAIVYG